MAPMETGPLDSNLATFLIGARVVCDALASEPVAACWDSPSVLKEQTVGGLAGHLARGALWVVGDYLDRPEPEGNPVFASAADYYVAVVTHLDEAAHRAIRERGAAVASAGPAVVAITARTRLDELKVLLPELGPDRKLAVFGQAVMRLGDYVGTRVVEQAVHLDDLARSVEGAAWSVPEPCLQLAVDVGVDLASRRSGATELVRALYRRDATGTVFPVL